MDLGAPAVELPPVIVTAERVPQRLGDVPVSDTVVSGQTIKADQIQTVDQAATYVPNLVENRFSQTRWHPRLSAASALAKTTRRSRSTSTACRS